MPTHALRIGMWSGPRNISTAMMRAWGSRDDTIVCDEPLYAHYLQTTGYDHHPGAAKTLAAQPTDWREVVAELTGPIPTGKTIYYQKQMAHHLLPNIDRGWIDKLTNCFLIRDPYEMLTSLVDFLPNPTAADTGLPQQVELFEQEQKSLGSVPPVLDSHDVLANPEGMLKSLCSAIDVEFDTAMLSWAPGIHSTDGAWADEWYGKVAQTTGFSINRPFKAELPDHLQPILDECRPMYEQLFAQRITATT